MTDRRTEVLKALRDKAYDCTPDDFRDLLCRFAADDAALAALHQGVKDRARREDGGDYTSSATPGYATVRRKEKMLQECYLGLPPFDGGKPAGTATVAELQETITELTARVEKLEQNAKGIPTLPPIKLKQRKP